MSLEQLLKFDPLSHAEDITGHSIHEDGGFKNPAVALGFLLMQENNAAKERALVARGDTTFGDALSRYLEIIVGAGFERALELPFLSSYASEKYFIFARRDGLLLSFDTYNGKSVNGGKVYYNWKPENFENSHFRLTSSGHLSKDGVWIGDHDCREALLFNMGNLSANGKFVAPWVERPFLWLLHYQDTKADGYSYDDINNERIAMLPEWVREMISPV